MRREKLTRAVATCVVITTVGMVLTGGCAPRPAVKTHATTGEGMVAEAVEILENEALYARGAPWDSAALAATEASRGSSDREAYALIAGLVRTAGGIHSGVLTKDEVEKRRTGDVTSPTVVTVEGVSVVTLPTLTASGDEAISAYRSAGISSVDRAVADTRCGWIVDLRENMGGNVYPMLSTIAPLFPDGEIASFVDRDGRRESVSSRSGSVDAYGEPRVSRERSDKPIAVLLSRQTASAAELVAVALSGAETVRSFGQETAGLTTSNRTFELSDGTMLVVTVANYADAAGEIVHGSLIPDHVVNTRGAVGAEFQAEAWLKGLCDS